MTTPRKKRAQATTSTRRKVRVRDWSRTVPELLAAQQILEWRTQRNLSQAEMAARLGVTRRTVIRWEAGDFLAPGLLTLALDGLDLRMAMPEVVPAIRKACIEVPG